MITLGPRRSFQGAQGQFSGRLDEETQRPGTLGDLREIESAASKLAVQGARHPEHLARLVGR
jgi:hypothetical protein